MELVETITPPTWPARLSAMAIGNTMDVALKNAASVRGAISRTLPNSGVEMEFETKTKTKVIKRKEVRYIEVKRVK
jgi:hypothetical protein